MVKRMSCGGILTKCIYSSRHGPSQKRDGEMVWCHPPGIIPADANHMHRMISLQVIMPVLERHNQVSSQTGRHACSRSWN